MKPEHKLSTTLINLEDVVEILSSELHDIWSNWFTYQRDCWTKPNMARWDKQSSTEYKDLSEEDKEKDRKIAREIIKKLPQYSNEQEWISVEERLPEEWIEVIWIEKYWYKKIWISWKKSFIQWDFATLFENCIYWMPLPQSPITNNS